MVIPQSVSYIRVSKRDGQNSVTLYIYLKRDQLDKRNRLDHLLLERANAGVKVCVLIWDESNLGVNLNSRWAKLVLEKLHKYSALPSPFPSLYVSFSYVCTRNVRVIRHPRFSLSWSHHQKTVIVDQNVAFLGGIDLCPGRYDDDLYLYVDILGFGCLLFSFFFSFILIYKSG